MNSPTPSAQAPMVDQSMRPTPTWFRFFASLGAGTSPPAAETVPLSGSPATWTAPRPGVLSIAGGTVTALSMTRARTSLALPAGAAILPLGNGDEVTITYSAAPTVTFLPS